MFSAFKKLTSKSCAELAAAAYPVGTGHVGVNAMDVSLQRKFGRGGLHYNMKLVLRGDRNTGKTSLYRRLQGHAFNDEDYLPTNEIQVAHIQWNYKATEDVVKVEVWDVVDKGKKKPKRSLNSSDSSAPSLKISNQKILEKRMEDLTLDADLVDVYKGCHAVVFLMDVTKMWTFDYVKRELPKVPKTMPVLVMANFIDKGHHRQVTREQAIGFVDDMTGYHDIHYVESSMRNGFGLKFLHKFLNVPYLHLQRQSLKTQLDINGRELEATALEMELFLASEEADYDLFLEGVTQKRRSKAEGLAPPSTVSVVVGQPSNTIQKKSVEELRAAKEISISKGLEAIAEQEAKVKGKKSLDDDGDLFILPDDVAASEIDRFLEVFEDASEDAVVVSVKNDSDEDVNPMVMTVKEDEELSDLEMQKPSSNSISNRVRVYSNRSTSTSSGQEERGEPKITKELDFPPFAKKEKSTQLLVNDEEMIHEEELERKRHSQKNKKEKKRKKKGKERQKNDLEEFLNGTTAGYVTAENYEEL